MSRGLELAAELRERKTERFRAPEFLRIAIALWHRTSGALFLALVHPFLNPVLCVDKTFA